MLIYDFIAIFGLVSLTFGSFYENEYLWSVFIFFKIKSVFVQKGNIISYLMKDEISRHYIRIFNLLFFIFCLAHLVAIGYYVNKFLWYLKLNIIYYIYGLSKVYL